MAVVFPNWMHDFIKQGNGIPRTVSHPRGDSFKPYICCRDLSIKEERRAELDLDHWAFERWAREGYGQYLWHCSIPSVKEAKWHLDRDFPPDESPVLIYLMRSVPTLMPDYLAPGLYLGRCKREADAHVWKAKHNRYAPQSLPVWLNLNNSESNNKRPLLFWLPLPVNKK